VAAGQTAQKWFVDETALGAASVKALAEIAVIREQGGQMPGAYDDAMAAPRLAGSFKVKIHRRFYGSWTTNEGRCFTVSGAS
jgi:hypothetical protein